MALKKAPVSMRRRGPMRSTSGPMKTMDIPPRAVAREMAAANCHTSICSASTRGSRKTPETICPVLVAMNCASMTPTRMYQP